jgi:hypothetical protein
MYNICNTYYGSYRTRTFADIFPTYDDFYREYTESKLNIDLGEGFTLDQLYYMLYAHYGNSHISYSDEHQFKYYLYTIIFQYGPTASKERYIQNQLRALSDEELTIGGKAIYNHSYNPSTAPSTATLEELTTINDQNTTNYKKSKMEGYAMLIDLLKRDVLDEFIHKFARLFIRVAAPDHPLLYTTMEDNY